MKHISKHVKIAEINASRTETNSKIKTHVLYVSCNLKNSRKTALNIQIAKDVAKENVKGEKNADLQVYAALAKNQWKILMDRI